MSERTLNYHAAMPVNSIIYRFMPGDGTDYEIQLTPMIPEEGIWDVFADGRERERSSIGHVVPGVNKDFWRIHILGTKEGSYEVSDWSLGNITPASARHFANNARISNYTAWVVLHAVAILVQAEDMVAPETLLAAAAAMERAGKAFPTLEE